MGQPASTLHKRADTTRREKDKQSVISLTCRNVKKDKLETEDRLAVARRRGERVEEMDGGGQKVQFQFHKSQRCNIQHGDCSQQHCVVPLKVAKRVYL